MSRALAVLPLFLGACVIDAPRFYNVDARDGDATLVDAEPPDAQLMLQHRLFVAGDDALRAYDLETDALDPSSIALSGPPTATAALEDGTLIVHTTQELLFVDGRSMTELERHAIGQTLVRGLLSPVHAGKQFWFALDDAADTATLVDVASDSPTRFEIIGNGIRMLGNGHHEAAFSTQLERIAITSSDDCAKVITVVSYENYPTAAPEVLATMTAADAGFDGVANICGAGNTPRPNGCATSSESGKVYCNLTELGDLVVVDIDATPPTFTLIPLEGTGGGPTKAAGRWVYSLQSTPRENGGGNVCELGRLVAVDATTDTVTAQLPLKREPGCTAPLPSMLEPRDLWLDSAGFRITVTLRATAAATGEILSLGTSLDPAMPAQLPTITTSLVAAAAARSGPGRRLYVAATEGLTPRVLEIDLIQGTVVDFRDLGSAALGLATFGAAEGAGERTGEILPPALAACENGVDDDKDGETDYPMDTDCRNPSDDTENLI